MSEGRFWAVVPAAGSGTRMGSELPKQYLTLLGKTVLEHTLQGLLASEAFQRLVVVLAAHDPHWQSLALARDPRIVIATGAAERCQSVCNGLVRLGEFAAPHDWVAVHDAARPCLTPDDLHRVLAAAQEHPDGALLAVPLADTLKRADAHGRVDETVSRARLWRALTPQVFRLAPLHDALQAALAGGLQPTDEAQAMELAGYRPRLVEGSAANLKITQPDDLRFAETLLQHRRPS